MQKSSDFPLFLLEDFDETIVLLDGVGSEITLADFDGNTKVSGIEVDTNTMQVTIHLESETRVYPLLKKPGSLLDRATQSVVRFVGLKK